MGFSAMKSDATPVHSDLPPVTFMFMCPVPSRIPVWARLAGQEYTHVVTLIGDRVWDQPINAPGACYDAIQWAEAAQLSARHVMAVTLSSDEADSEAVLDCLQEIAGRKGQRIRTMLRHLRLWPFRPWNCLSPVRKLAAIYGHPVSGETPDDVLEELVAQIDGQSHQ